MKKKIIIVTIITFLVIFSITGITLLTIGIINSNKPIPETPNSPEPPTIIEVEGEKEEIIVLEKPVITISADNISYDSFDFIIKMEDKDNCGKISSFKICDSNNNSCYEKINNTIEKEISDSISGLLGNNTYSIIVSYQYDINDSNGLQKDDYSISVKTIGYNAPVLTINELELLYNKYDFNLTVQDESNSLNIEKIYLYLNDQLIQDLNNELFSEERISIENLNSSNNYKLYVEYSYDLLDGKGKISKRIFKEFTTPLKEQEDLIPSTSEDEVSITVDDIILPNSGYTLINPTYSWTEDKVNISFSVPTTSETRILIFYDPTSVESKLLLRYAALYASNNSNVIVYAVDMTPIMEDENVLKNETLLNSARSYFKYNSVTVNKIKVLSDFSIPKSTTYLEFTEYLESYIKQ